MGTCGCRIVRSARNEGVLLGVDQVADAISATAVSRTHCTLIAGFPWSVTQIADLLY